MESIKKNKILLSIFAIVFVVFIYFFFFNGGGGSSQISIPGAPLPGGLPSFQMGTTEMATTSQNNVVAVLQEISQTQIDTSLFSQPAWTSLQDFSQSIPTDAPGKPDLFTPIPGSK